MARHEKGGESEWEKLIKRTPGRPPDWATEEELWAKVSKELDYTNPEMVRDVYYALVKVIGRELRRCKIVRLPGLADMYIYKNKEKVVVNPSVGRVVVPSRWEVRVRVVDRLRDYFHLLSDKLF